MSKILLVCGWCLMLVSCKPRGTIEPIDQLEIPTGIEMVQDNMDAIWLLGEFDKGYRYRVGADVEQIDSIAYSTLLYADNNLIIAQDTFGVGEHALSVRTVNAWNNDGTLRWQRSLGAVMNKGRVGFVNSYLHLKTDEHLLLEPASGAVVATNNYSRLQPLAHQNSWLWLKTKVDRKHQSRFYWLINKQNEQLISQLEDTLFLSTIYDYAYDHNDSITYLTASRLYELDYRPIAVFNKNTLEVVDTFHIPLQNEEERYVFTPPVFYSHQNGVYIYDKKTTFCSYINDKHQYQRIPFEFNVYHIWNKSAEEIYVLAGCNFYSINHSTQTKQLLWTHNKKLLMGIVHQNYLYAVDETGLFFRKKMV
jgi:hypothetical protein